jgi:hypothetical protein
MSKQQEADLILKLYELRREATMRKARDWYFMEFHPESIADYEQALFSEHSGYLRMVVSYWDMAASLVNHDAISAEFFNEANGEHFGVFSKLELLLPEIRAKYGPTAMLNLERLIDTTPGGRERSAATRERMQAIRTQMAGKKTMAAG